MKQIIIAIGREFGSGGHLVAKKLAEHYNIPLYSKELLDEVAKDGRYSKEVLERFDEKPMNFAFIPVPAGGTTRVPVDAAGTFSRQVATARLAEPAHPAGRLAGRRPQKAVAGPAAERLLQTGTFRRRREPRFRGRARSRRTGE